jgi:Flp pilus assembly protein CpaB
MKRIGLVVVLGLILTMATVWVLGYARGVDGDVLRGEMVAVVVSEVDIPAGADLNELIKNDQFRLIEILADDRVDGAITSVDQMSGKSNSVAILARTQILAGQLRIVAERHRLAPVGR